MKAKPFLKYAGNKFKLAPIIASHMPERIGKYRDRFCGAGGMYFHLANDDRFESAEASDKNPEIINVWLAIQFKDSRLIETIERLTETPITKDRYLEIRSVGFSGYSGGDPIEAARTILLNKCGFNGLYRLNQSGDFNVPYGKRTSPAIDFDNIRSARSTLRSTHTITYTEDALHEHLDLDLASGDACYYDPPYIPVSTTASFTAYDGHPFTLDDQRRLAAKADAVASNGACVIISNSDTDEAREIFGKIPGVEVHHLSRAGTMNSDKSKRGRVSELLFVINGRKQ